MLQYLNPRNANTKIVNAPQMAESISEGVLASYTKQVGDYVDLDEELALIETDNIDVAVNAPDPGIVTKLLVGEGDTVTVGQALIEIDVDAREKPTSSAKDSEPQRVKDLAAQQYSAEQKQQQSMAPAASSSLSQEASVSAYGDSSRAENKVKMIRMRLRTAERLKESQNTTAFLTTFNEVDMSQVIAMRKQYKDEVLDKQGVKLGFMGPVARASAMALNQIPAVNAAIENDDTIVFRDYVDLSIAVATPKGLVTPVLRNIERKSVVGIEQGIAELGKKARDSKLAMNDLTGGTFTVSNSGIWGSLFGTPIINMPQSAVLGIYGIQERPVVIDGEAYIRSIMHVALTYDHRLVDGREAVILLALVKKYLEDPASMLLI
ncbi:dihydrolipoamide succinyltransferase [Aspergillus ruber CBS 135680]|uniref:Dihydrolipoamide acetyltransferase component of pyruvate dehydrogenase complex n=1 Tax=Aspergillus ruber (strain CBS 135680) TaxID=1388766 RepID=A0A017S7T0_ASPRC|nr:dihydrolipoamide succinyltransferase [Aspergillus ruber CBS 135680]EYE93063.1 dihydrolipoamide succinyltransferase [Aspergillus ruber CBS 135680]